MVGLITEDITEQQFQDGLAELARHCGSCWGRSRGNHPAADRRCHVWGQELVHKGPGETKLETERRTIGRRIAQLQQEVNQLQAHRSRLRHQREQQAIPVIALVGYTLKQRLLQLIDIAPRSLQ